MKVIISFFFFIMTINTFAQDNILSSDEKNDGWKLLFNGSDMNQWRNFKKQDINPKWQVKEGSMILTGKGGGDIMTKDQYENFDFRMEWKISEGGNSGIFILADEKGKKIYSHAPEIQILDNEKHSDRKKPNHRSGSLYDMITSPAESHKKAGEWNQVRIKLNKGQLQVWQNEVQTVDILIGSDKWNELVGKSKFKSWKGFAKTKKGHLGLQDHNDKVSFKNLKIKELK
ncbi:DUF1080 domain-containing protein [Lentisphaera profundi]|uniref:DUF1080 domain-containing protein n=1 Tax=Lentisphaera profundi TaxID=1658616 RepID=A0ABY7W166_9BACT|nr:DUF1080 domain-containing protein [Lentisphaera profundi]WDE99218.1 DUF1080 domain-containing protein [Lentisphaera profundi]